MSEPLETIEFILGSGRFSLTMCLVSRFEQRIDLLGASLLMAGNLGLSTPVAYLNPKSSSVIDAIGTEVRDRQVNGIHLVGFSLVTDDFLVVSDLQRDRIKDFPYPILLWLDQGEDWPRFLELAPHLASLGSTIHA